MATKILIPTPLRPYTDKQDAVDADGATVGELLADLTTKHAGLKAHLYNEQGKLRSFVNIYVNDEDIRYLQKEQTPVKRGRHAQHHPVGRRRRRSRRPIRRQAAPVCDAGRDAAELTNDEIKRYSRHLIMPEVGVDGQRKLKAAQRAVHRRRRTRLAGGDVSRRGRRRHASASSTSTSSTSATCSGRSSTARPTSAGRSSRRPRTGSTRSTRTSRSRRYETALSSENALELFAPYDVILDGTDNFPDALSRERRVRAARQAERLRQHLPVRRAGVGLRDQGRSVLPLPLSGAAAARPGAELRGRRRAGRAAGHHRRDSGDRGDQADHRHRRAADRPLPDLRRAEDEVPRAEAAERSGLPGVRHAPDRHQAHRLRAVLRHPARRTGACRL